MRLLLALFTVLALACDMDTADDPLTLPSVLIIDDIVHSAEAEPHPHMLSVRVDVTNRGDTAATIQVDVCTRLVAFRGPPASAADIVWEEEAAQCGVEFTEERLLAGEIASFTKQLVLSPLAGVDEYYLGIRFRTAAGEPVLLSGARRR